MYDEPSEILDDTGLDLESDSEYPGVLTDEEASAMACYLDCLESNETNDRSSKRRAVWRWLTLRVRTLASLYKRTWLNGVTCSFRIAGVQQSTGKQRTAYRRNALTIFVAQTATERFKYER